MKTILLDSNKSADFNVGKNEEKQLVILITEPGKIKLNVNLTGKNAKAEILGIVLGQKDGLIDLNTTQNHAAFHTESNLLIKSVMMNSSQFNFSGLIKMEKNAQKSSAYQRNENILLSPQAKVQSKPYLEILANDVICTHAATMGQIDEEQIFYLNSRGIDRKTSQKLIINGFLRSLLDKISDLDIVDIINKKLKENGYASIL